MKYKYPALQLVRLEVRHKKRPDIGTTIPDGTDKFGTAAHFELQDMHEGCGADIARRVVTQLDPFTDWGMRRRERFYYQLIARRAEQTLGPAQAEKFWDQADELRTGRLDDFLDMMLRRPKRRPPNIRIRNA